MTHEVVFFCTVSLEEILCRKILRFYPVAKKFFKYKAEYRKRVIINHFCFCPNSIFLYLNHFIRTMYCSLNYRLRDPCIELKLDGLDRILLSYLNLCSINPFNYRYIEFQQEELWGHLNNNCFFFNIVFSLTNRYLITKCTKFTSKLN